MKERQQFTDRDFELFGVWPSNAIHAPVNPRRRNKARRIFLILAALAVVAGALWAAVH